MRIPRSLLAIAAVLAAVTLGAAACTPPASQSRAEDIVPGLSPRGQQDVVRVEAEIDRIEGQTLARLAVPPSNLTQQVELLGKAMMYDKQLSVNRNEACAFCHMPETGFTGPISELNATTGAYPGSVRTRFSNRKPQSHAYAALSPVLHYNTARGDLVGGNFWDMRATGRRLGNPAAEQAEGPPVNPVEMGLPDIACAVYRASQRPYRRLFEAIWGRQAFAIAWPGNVEQACNQPGPPTAGDPLPVHLSPRDRGLVGATFDQMAQSIAGFEAAARGDPVHLQVRRRAGGERQVHAPGEAGLRALPRQGACATTATATAAPARIRCSPTSPPSISARRPIRGCPSIGRTSPTGAAMWPIRRAPSYVDGGVGAFLSGAPQLSHPSAVDARWRPLAASNFGRVQVPTLRNVDKRPYPTFVKAYGHNGYFTSLKMIVHFYNTRDMLRRCRPHDPGEGTTCWPAPETARNLDTTELGHLGLTDAQEDDIVAFLKTLTDGYVPARQP